MERSGFRFKTVGLEMADKPRCIEVAKAFAEEGAQLIELCGAFGTEGSARVIEAIDRAVPVGNVSYPLTDLNAIHGLLSGNVPDK